MLTYAGGGKVVKGGLSQLGKMFERTTNPLGNRAVDPLSYAIALRQSAELEKAGELLGTKPGALTQLYADPKLRNEAILKQAEARAREQEQLQNPGRREFVKRTGALAARHLLPGNDLASRMARELMSLDAPKTFTVKKGDLKDIFMDLQGEYDPEIDDIFSLLGNTSPSFADFLKNKGVQVLGKRVQFDPARFDDIEREAEAIREEYDAGKPLAGQESLWEKYDLGGDDDVDYNSGYVQSAITALRGWYLKQTDPAAYADYIRSVGYSPPSTMNPSPPFELVKGKWVISNSDGSLTSFNSKVEADEAYAKALGKK